MILMMNRFAVSLQIYRKLISGAFFISVIRVLKRFPTRPKKYRHVYIFFFFRFCPYHFQF
jgi:hypothetical protein